MKTHSPRAAQPAQRAAAAAESGAHGDLGGLGGGGAVVALAEGSAASRGATRSTQCACGTVGEQKLGGVPPRLTKRWLAPPANASVERV